MPSPEPDREAELWAASGALALTGRADGPPLGCAGAPASAVRTALDQLRSLGVAGLPGLTVLSERASLSGMVRNAPFSVGGCFQILRASDGWVGLSLPRDSDLELLPALTESTGADDPWEAVGHWLGRTSTAAADARIALLGMAGGSVPLGEPDRRRAPVLVCPGGARTVRSEPLVVDLSSLWAGPLCAHILTLAGARVITVESTTRPDISRHTTPEFFDRLHTGHEFVYLDFATQRDRLEQLVQSADVVVESSRPRALRQLGIDAAHHVARGAIWVSITAYGRGHMGGMRVGFGDDVAAGAGLVSWDRESPVPAGDALADPLTGLAAAVAAVQALRLDRGRLIDVSMHDVAVRARRSSIATLSRSDILIPDGPERPLGVPHVVAHAFSMR